MINRHAIIVLVSIIVIACSLGYSSLNVISAKDLEFSWPHQSFEFTSVIIGKTLEVCNNSDLPATFQKYSFTIHYDENELGTFSTGGGGFAPHTSGNVYGKFTSNDERISNIFLSFMDTEAGGTDVARMDLGKLKITTTLDTTILGVIPLSIPHQYSGEEFMKMLNTKTSCG